VGQVAVLVVDDEADQRVGLVDAGAGDQQLFTVRAAGGVALADQGLTGGAFGLQFLRARLAGGRRAQA
jgi:hypothetical protein